jgi:hypothetical protein
VIKTTFKIHRSLAWLGGLTLIIFAVSGITHPVITWSGPQAVVFYPPQGVIDSSVLEKIAPVLNTANLTSATSIKLVPKEDVGVLLQITTDANHPRRYFNLSTGQELPNHDEKYAIWLARYYSGLPATNVLSATFQSSFSADYPKVNRILPVYKVAFNTEDNLTLFIHTELLALGDLTNDWKRLLQKIFKIGHTWNFLNQSPNLKVLIISAMILSLLTITISGAILLRRLRARSMPKYRKAHRYLGIVVLIPLIMLSSSGLFHLLHSHLIGRKSNIKDTLSSSHTPNLLLNAQTFSSKWDLPATKINGANLVEGPDKELFLRIGISPLSNNQNLDYKSRNQRFNGVPTETSPAMYLSVKSGAISTISDKDVVLHHANNYFNVPNNKISQTQIITRFNAEYDFRNKRLPVWRVDTLLPEKPSLFIDPVDGALVDELTPSYSLERWSFSIFHKWNFLTPFIGRQARDIILVIILILAIATTFLGFRMLLIRFSPRKK